MKPSTPFLLLAFLLTSACASKTELRPGSPGENGILRKYPVLHSYAKASLQLIPDSPKGFSKLGGLPDVPASFAWPQWKGRPLAFICQLKLSEVPALKDSPLPAKGLLYFFYDQDQSTWGFDPKDQGSWKLIYVEDEPKSLTQASPPPGLELAYTQLRMGFREVLTYPTWDSPVIQALRLGDQDTDDYVTMKSEAYLGQAAHRLGSYPDAIQNGDMELDCQLASNGLYCGDSTGYSDPRAAGLEKGKGDWIMLLQVDSDDRTDMMWGDAGMLYFWIRKQDLKQANFDEVWMILQCG